jgi:ankyrin repeat protein
VRVGDAAIIAALCGHRHKYTPPPNVDAFGAGGWTALGLATRAGNAAAAEALLAAGARADAKMGNGKTPLDIARINNKAAIVEMFERRASGGA